MNYIIITGASKGLGEGLAIELLDEQHRLICISRSESKKLKQLAAARNCSLEFILFDLSAINDIDTLCEEIFSHIDLKNAEGVFLVNNAGIINPVNRVEECAAEDVELHMRINLLAPMLLSSAFIGRVKDFPITKRIMNISSGAAHNPYYGWSCYCTAKAGLDMFGRCISEEQKDESHPVETMNVAPGIIDTGMQTTIRGTNERAFIHRKKFVEFKEKGQLIHPAVAGKKLAQLLLSEDFRDGQSVDVRDSY